MNPGKRVLIVDDELTTLDFHIRDLEQNGFHVERVDDVSDALRFALSNAPEHRFDAIVLDMMMPPGRIVEAHRVRQGLSTGAFLLNRFRENGHQAPVLVLTNLRVDEVLEFLREQDQFVRLLADLPHDESAAAEPLWAALRTRVEEKRRMPWFRLAPFLTDLIEGRAPREMTAPRRS